MKRVKDAVLREVLVAEAPYKYNLFDKNLTIGELYEAIQEARDIDQLVWIEYWIMSESHPEAESPEIHELMNRSWIFIDDK